MATASSLDSARGWLACGLALVVLFVAFGLAYSYGVFFPSIIDEFDVGRGLGAVFFSATSFIFFSLGSVSGPLCDRIGPRPLLVTGGILIGLGLWQTASAQTLMQAYVAYGLGVGVGVGCIYVPAVSAVGQWFEVRRTLALGIAVVGIGLGTLVYAPVSAALIDAVGWRRTYQIHAIAGALIIVLCGLLFPRPPAAAPTARHGQRISLLDRRYVGLYAATVFINIALFVPFVYLPIAAEAAGVPHLRAAGLVGALGIASVVGRLGMALLGDRVTLVTLYRWCFGIVGISFLLWVGAQGYAAYLAFAVIIGVAYGGYIALTPAVIAELFGSSTLGRLLGIINTAVAAGALIGPLAVGVGAEVSGGYSIVLVVMAALALLGLWPLRAAASSPVGAG